MTGTMEIRPCGGDWKCCAGACSECPAQKTYTLATSTENKPTWITEGKKDGNETSM